MPRKAVVEIMRVLGPARTCRSPSSRKPVRHADAELRDDRPTHRRTVSELGGRPAPEPSGRLALKRSSLSAALRRVSVMAEERNKPVRFVLASGSLTLSAASHDLGEAEEQLEVDYTGGELTIGFNSRYVLDALTPMEHDDVLFEFKDALSPGVLRSAADEGYCCVIMPMRI